MKKHIQAICIAASLFAVPQTAAAQDDSYKISGALPSARPGQLQMGEWARLLPDERQMVVIGAIESFYIMSNAAGADAPIRNPECLMERSTVTVEEELMSVAQTYPKQSFIDVFLGTTSCQIAPITDFAS